MLACFMAEVTCFLYTTVASLSSCFVILLNVWNAASFFEVKYQQFPVKSDPTTSVLTA